MKKTLAIIGAITAIGGGAAYFGGPFDRAVREIPKPVSKEIPEYEAAELNLKGVQHETIRQKIDARYRIAHDVLSEAYYEKKEFTWKGHNHGILSKEEFEELNELLWAEYDVLFHEENMKLPEKDRIAEIEYNYIRDRAKELRTQQVEVVDTKYNRALEKIRNMKMKVLTSLIFSLFFLIAPLNAHAVVWFDPFEITNLVSTANSWQDADLGDYLPSDATGAILHVRNTDSVDPTAFGWRKNGSTDARQEGVFDFSHLWYAVPVDTNQIVELYIGDLTELDVYLVGYFKDEAHFFTNAPDKSTATRGWTDVDISGDTVGGDVAIAAIAEINNVSTTFYGAGARNDGETRNDTASCPYKCSAIVGVTSEIYEQYISNAFVDHYLTGYFTKGGTFYATAQDYSLGSTGSWQDLSTLPTGALGGFFDADNANGVDYGLRKNGSTEDWSNYHIVRHHWGYVEADLDYKIEGYIGSTAIDFFLTGYATSSEPLPVVSDATSIGPTSATLNGTLKSLGDESAVDVFFNYGTSPWDYSATTSLEYQASTGTFSASISSLTPNTTYYFRAGAQASSTDLFYENQLSFTTAQCDPVQPISTNTFDSTSATIEGKLLDLCGQAELGIGFGYGIDGIFNATSTVNNATSTTGNYTGDISSLTTFEEYHFRAFASSTDAGIGFVYSSTTTTKILHW